MSLCVPHCDLLDVQLTTSHS